MAPLVQLLRGEQRGEVWMEAERERVEDRVARERRGGQEGRAERRGGDEEGRKRSGEGGGGRRRRGQQRGQDRREDRKGEEGKTGGGIPATC
eukprot:1949741-Rhodomonas_salina.1